jgi:hypothetical protein
VLCIRDLLYDQIGESCLGNVYLFFRKLQKTNWINVPAISKCSPPMYIAYVFRMWFLLLRQHKKWRDGVVQEIKKSARRELDLLNIMSDLKYPTKMCAPT